MSNVSVQRLMLDCVVQDLSRSNELRELPKPDDIVWQQMKLEYFETFLKEGFHFVRYDKLCSDNMGQEREWEKYYPDLTDRSHNIFISCWYNQTQLSKPIFDTYSKNGVAIGTKISNLQRALSTTTAELYFGNVQYISDDKLQEYGGKVVADYQKIAPVYLKKAQCSADKEFRVCLYKNDVLSKEFCKIECNLGEGWYIAVTDEATPYLDRMLKRKGLKKAESEGLKMDGFTVYEIGHMKTVDDVSTLNKRDFHSISFDSVQQRSALISSNSYLNYFRLTAILRLQILLTGRIVLTDAQVYDGLFFFWLANDGKFEDFLHYGKELDFLQIRVRDNQLFPTSMFSKSFICSAIESKELSNCIYKITSDMLVEKEISTSDEDIKNSLKERCMKENEDNPNEYLSKIEKYLNILYKNTYEEDWNMYKTRLQIIYESISKYKDVIKTWEKDKIIMESEDCMEVQKILNNLMKAEGDRHYCNSLFDKMAKELSNRRCKRSEFVNQCEELFKNCKSNENVVIITKELLQTFNKYYNQAIARNIECGTIYEISDFEEAAVASLDVLQVRKQLLWNLANLDWDEFRGLYEQSKVFDTLDERLTYIHGYSFKDYETSKPIPKDGPWNYQKTFDFSNAKIKIEDMKFINAEGQDADEMYIWCSDQMDYYNLKKKLTII